MVELTLTALVHQSRVGERTKGQLSRVNDLNENAKVKINRKRSEDFDASLVPGSGTGDRVQHHTKPHFVGVVLLDREPAVPDVRQIRLIAAQDAAVSRSDAQETVGFRGPQGRVQEHRTGPVGIQIDDVVEPLVQVHVENRVGIHSSHVGIVSQSVVDKILTDSFNGNRFDVVHSHVELAKLKLLDVPDRSKTGSGEPLQNPGNGGLR